MELHTASSLQTLEVPRNMTLRPTSVSIEEISPNNCLCTMGWEGLGYLPGSAWARVYGEIFLEKVWTIV